MCEKGGKEREESKNGERGDSDRWRMVKMGWGRRDIKKRKRGDERGKQRARGKERREREKNKRRDRRNRKG